MLDVFRQAWRDREADVKFFNGDNVASMEAKAQQLLTVFHESVDPTVHDTRCGRAIRDAAGQWNTSVRGVHRLD